eukprot:5354263-Prymnesium_polylepis.1
MGTVTDVNDDARRSMGGAKVNFFVEYDGEEEDGPVPHVLLIEDYRTTDDADYNSWLLLDLKGEAAPEAVVTEPTAEVYERFAMICYDLCRLCILYVRTRAQRGSNETSRAVSNSWPQDFVRMGGRYQWVHHRPPADTPLPPGRV